VASFIAEHFVPVEAHIKEHPAWFHRFDVSWTPSVLVLSPAGSEVFRIEGYLEKPEFRAELELGLARVAFKAKKWQDAEKGYAAIVERYPTSFVAAEAGYWAGVSQYQRTHDHTVLNETARRLAAGFPDSVWAQKSSPWLG